MSCEPGCYKTQVSDCAESLTIKGGFTPGVTYTWKIVDKFLNCFSGQSNASYIGSLVIDFSNLPDGLISRHGGALTLQFYDENGKLFEPVIADYYPCILIDGVGCDDGNSDQQIGV